ncbi:methyltransferase domain-containing protein [Dissulfurirhabdus thermomarina]|uniref:Methyltransferase domain-containing protein n=1 Tax=Dissulfurirhabdus thermomarina TaxID=1765737 RepID=A0A6N9TQ40_DISTH|nr:methionine biosynthesis protein MetW [Dissulfurirhabdus thermomarina]NDY41854.1 methyltransferase domain-containing protein [Dissulfurirhabdus thermomarina]NMX22620.1 methyltransferase domain-containing protein [Dissulfurirhabdus thermomarina]
MRPGPAVDWARTRLRDRALDPWIAGRVPRGARVLDLGCGDGALLQRIERERAARGTGIELDPGAAAEAIARGLCVAHGDIEAGLRDFAAGTFDVVILNQVLPLLRDPAAALETALRLAPLALVTVPNFAHWRIRLRLGLRGRLPVTAALPYGWHETPHIRLVTVADFRILCRERKIGIRGEAFAAIGRRGEPRPVRRLPGLRAALALFELEAGPRTRSEWRRCP